ncbi:MAG: hypothetical protein PVI09_14825 [Anaerolineae bacterium]
MTEPNNELDNDTSYLQHPLYQTAMDHMAAGEEPEAAENLRELADIYPDDQELRDLLVRIELKAAFSGVDYVTADRRKPTPILRRVLLMLLGITLAIIAVFALIAAYNSFVIPQRQEAAFRATVTALENRGAQQLDAGAWSGAIQTYNDLLKEKPGDPTAIAAIATAEAEQAFYQFFESGITLQEQGDLPGALGVYQEVQRQRPGYRDVDARIEQIQEQLRLEEIWQQVQGLAQAGAWQEVIDTLIPVRLQSPSFRRTEVENLLFQAYVELARQQIAQANADPAQLRTAIDYYDRALKLRAGNQAVNQERRLAVQFVTGVDLYEDGDVLGAVREWEEIYDVDPGYQGGVLDDRLSQAYPQAARQLLDQANGSPAALREAIRLIELALRYDPNDEELVTELRLARDYLPGAEAFAAEDWDAAIQAWGPLYGERPTYQNGALESNLREACANAEQPDDTYCAP